VSFRVAWRTEQAVNRADLHVLADERVREARALLDAGLWSGAYYLVGYAVECGLKACVLNHVEETGIIFLDRRFSEKCWTHNLEELVKLAGLEPEFGLDRSRNPNLEVHWFVVRDWNEGARYQGWPESKARQLFEAVTHTTDGVLPWIRARW
jgi:HEPN domain-containing protein